MSKSERDKPHLVVLSGAGMSAESGLKTFRDSGGLWEGYDVKDVATPDAWHRNPGLVLQFYNERRRALSFAEPNQGHRQLADLQESFRVSIITQNVDDLHERAGSVDVLHLHGELKKSRSTADLNLVYEIEGTELRDGDRCELGSQLRPHIVWFGEEVPLMERAVELVMTADVFAVIGSSLVVYPAAGLVEVVDAAVPCYLVDLHPPGHLSRSRFTAIEEPASQGVLTLARHLRAKMNIPDNSAPRRVADIIQ